MALIPTRNVELLLLIIFIIASFFNNASVYDEFLGFLGDLWYNCGNGPVAQLVRARAS